MRGAGRLSKTTINEVVSELIYAFLSCKTVEEMVLFLQDLLTKSELQVLSRRLRIAKLLLEGSNYESIERSLHVSHATIAKIAAWLSERGEGFRDIVKKLPKKPEVKDPLRYSEWDNLKKRYPMYFWPELVLEEILRNANKRQKEKLKRTLNRLDQTLEEKSLLNRELEKLLR